MSLCQLMIPGRRNSGHFHLVTWTTLISVAQLLHFRVRPCCHFLRVHTSRTCEFHPEVTIVIKKIAQDTRTVPAPAHPVVRTLPAPAHPVVRSLPAPAHPVVRSLPAPAHPVVRSLPAPAHPAVRSLPAPAHPAVRTLPAPAHPAVQSSFRRG